MAYNVYGDYKNDGIITIDSIQLLRNLQLSTHQYSDNCTDSLCTSKCLFVSTPEPPFLLNQIELVDMDNYELFTQKPEPTMKISDSTNVSIFPKNPSLSNQTTKPITSISEFPNQTPVSTSNISDSTNVSIFPKNPSLSNPTSVSISENSKSTISPISTFTSQPLSSNEILMLTQLKNINKSLLKITEQLQFISSNNKYNDILNQTNNNIKMLINILNKKQY